MRTKLRRHLVVVSLFLAVPMLTLAALNFTTIDRFGAQDTLPSGINNEGVIAGTSETAAQANANTEEGFLLRNGKYKTIFFPGAFDTDLGAVNDSGVVFGTYDEGNPFENYCFEWSAEEGYEKVNLPINVHSYPDCNGINGEGDRVGSFVSDCLTSDLYCNFTGTTHGFLLTEDGKFTQYDYPGAIGTELFGINEDRYIVGTFIRPNGGNDGAFVLHKGIPTEIVVPGSTSVDAYAISDRGVIGGSYTACHTVSQVTTCTDHGFVLKKGKITTIDVNIPGAETNKVTGVNDAGWIVGVYTKNNIEHGFKVNMGDD